jgi:twitching motility protein PilT
MTGQPRPSGDVFADLLSRMEASDASDLHLQVGVRPCIRVTGRLLPQEDLKPTDGVWLEALLNTLLPKPALERLEKRGACDAGVQLEGVRLRLNAFKHLNGLAVSMRRIPMEPPLFHRLNIPAVVKHFANLPRGLVVLCGPTGSGKSTTLASLIHLINTTRRAHIITIEDPIEFLHESKLSLVAQREIGEHTPSFADALRDALREDPNVILVGEMRDLETIELALRAAETGHLVFSTLHTSGAAGSVSRIVDVFEPASRETVRIQLSLVLMGIVSQLLVPTLDGKSRVPICEIMVVNDAVRNLIRENKFEQIVNVIQSGGDDGMVTFAGHAAELVRSGKIDSSLGMETVGEGRRVADMLFGH